MKIKHKMLGVMSMLVIASSVLAGCGHTKPTNNANHIKHINTQRSIHKHFKKPLIVNKSHKAQHEKQSLWQQPKVKNTKKQ